MTIIDRWIGLATLGCTLLLAGPVLARDAHHAATLGGTGCPAALDGTGSNFAAPCGPRALSDAACPLAGRPPSPYAEPAGPPLVADLHVAATDLGFRPGVGPAPGRTLSYLGHKYRVTDIVVTGGGPGFSGGSAFVVGVKGSLLMIGLKSIIPGGPLDPDRFEVSVVN